MPAEVLQLNRSLVVARGAVGSITTSSTSIRARARAIVLIHAAPSVLQPHHELGHRGVLRGVDRRDRRRHGRPPPPCPFPILRSYSAARPGAGGSLRFERVPAKPPRAVSLRPRPRPRPRPSPRPPGKRLPMLGGSGSGGSGGSGCGGGSAGRGGGAGGRKVRPAPPLPPRCAGGVRSADARARPDERLRAVEERGGLRGLPAKTPRPVAAEDMPRPGKRRQVHGGRGDGRGHLPIEHSLPVAAAAAVSVAGPWELVLHGACRQGLRV